MRHIILSLSFTILFNFCFAQKKPIDHSVYDSWQNISSAEISKDGKWIYYTISPQEGDTKLVLTNPNGKKIQEANRAANATFTSDSKYLTYIIKAPFKDTREAKIKKKKADDMPSDSLGILTLANQHLFKTSEVKSFKIPEENAYYIAYLKKTIKDTTAAKAVKDTATTNTAKKTIPVAKATNTNDLFLRNLATGDEKVFKNIDTYAFNKDGSSLYFVQKAADKDTIAKDAGLYIYHIANQELKHISVGKGEYKNIVFDDKGTQLSFTAYKGKDKALTKIYKLYYYTSKLDTAIILAGATTKGLPSNWSISSEGQMRFSKNGEKLFFGTSPIARVKDTTLVDFENAQVDIWHWNEDYLQPQQLANLKRDLNKSYLSVITPSDAQKSVIVLSDAKLPYTSLSKDANSEYILATTDFGRRVETQWKIGAVQDVYIVSTKDGQRHKIASGIRGNISFSPTGNYVIWFDQSDSNWYTYSVKTGQTHNLTKEISVNFADEDFDMPDEAGAYGSATWSANDEQVFINDKYDVWSFNPDGKSKLNLTNGEGRKNKLTYRLYAMRESEMPRSENSTGIDLKKPVYLTIFNHLNKENGWAKINPKTGKQLNHLTVGPFAYKQAKVTDDGKTLIYLKENYELSPNLYVSSDFKNELKISDINQQQNNFNWGTAELVKWTTPNGLPAEGILYKPEDFDPSKKYPMISYFYEIVTDGLYSYIAPAPTPSRLNISYFVSNGYLVFTPDIRYETGYPGKAAEIYVNSGVDYLVANHPYVDSKRLGIQGQSWGGYQVAHLITRTNKYAAAWSGAPVVNMTSAYGGIRWQSGMSRQFQYEQTQSRIGQTLWENPDLYIENSPLFHFPKVNTPVVIMANDADGAVPWYQGIEMFTALRRLQKPVWLLNYNGDEHNLMKRQNRKDIQIREQQFFDHYLKGKPAPVWLESGIPATLKGIDWGFDLVD